MCASAASFGLMELVLTVLEKKVSPTHMALLFLPEFAAAAVMAAVFGVLFRTRFTPLLAFSGMAFLTAAAALLVHVTTGGRPAHRPRGLAHRPRGRRVRRPRCSACSP